MVVRGLRITVFGLRRVDLRFLDFLDLSEFDIRGFTEPITDLLTSETRGEALPASTVESNDMLPIY